MKKLFWMILILTLLAAILPMAATAASSGSCGANGDNLTWSLDDEGVLTIEGMGDMSDYPLQATDEPETMVNTAPWGDGVTRAVIGEGVTRIGVGAFAGCAALKEVSLPYGVVEIGQSAFADCAELEKVVFPDSVTTVGAQAFQRCSMLTDVTLSKNLAAIYQRTFSNCYSLNSIVIPGSVEGVYAYAFENCGGLMNVCIEEGVGVVARYAFTRCGLERVTIPASVTSVGPSAFARCYGLSNITALGMNTAFDASAVTVSTPVVHCFPNSTAAAWAQEKNYPVAYNSGSCGAEGSNVTWSLNDQGVLTISGTGDIQMGDDTPLAKDAVRKIVIEDGVTGICSYAFLDCPFLTEVEISDSVTFVGEEAFALCPHLTSVSCAAQCFNQTSFQTCPLSDITITGSDVIENVSFSIYPDLTSVTIAEGVMGIGAGTFNSCVSLREVSIPDSVSWIGEFAFAYCEALTSIVIPGNVVHIDEAAFFECRNLKNVMLNEGLEVVGSNVFANCVSLESVMIPDSVLTIGYYAFSECTSLSAVTLSRNLGTIEQAAFSNCESLSEITIPDGVVSIGDNAFQNCFGLTRLTLPEGLITIGNGAFVNCDALTEVTFPEGMISIGSYAFDDCDDLRKVFIPDSVVSLSGYPFPQTDELTVYCYKGSYAARELTDSYHVVYLYASSGVCGAEEGESNLTWSLSDDMVLTIRGEGAMREFVFIGENVTDAPWDSGLRKVVIEAGVASVSNYAFSECTSLTDVVVLGDSVTFGDWVFAGSPTIHCIEGSAVAEWAMRIGYPIEYNGGYCGSENGGRNVAWMLDEQGVLMISGTGDMKDFLGYARPWDYKAVKSLIVNQGVTNISRWAFRDCANMTEAHIADSVTSIGDTAFSGCASLTSVDLPDNLQAIGYYAFGNCSSLTRVVIPQGVAVIEQSAFEWCESLESVSIPDALISIGDEAFNCCKALTDIELPIGLKSIGERAFASCENLSAVQLPEGLERLGAEAFYGCGALREIFIPASVSQIDYNPFQFCSQIRSIGVSSANSAYRAVDGALYTADMELVAWPAGRGGKVELPEGVARVGAYAFASCGGMTSVSFPNSLTSIGERAFVGCFNLSKLIIPKDVISIGTEALDCYNLKDVFFFGMVTAFGDNVVRTDPDTPIIHCAEGSDAAAWALSNGYPIRYFDPTEGVFDSGFCGASGDGQNLIWALDVNGLLTIEGTGDMQDYYFILVDEEARLYDNAAPWGSAVKQVRVGSGVTSIGNAAFAGCVTLADISLPDTLNRIGDGAFVGCRDLTSLDMPDSVTDLGGFAFEYCSSLADVRISRGISVVYANTFNECVSLRRIVIPGGVSTVYVRAFENCAGLSEVVLEDGVGAVGAYAFTGCASLTEITIPDSVSFVGNSAFSGCTNLAEVTVLGVATRLYSNVFESAPVVRCYEGSAAASWALENGCAVVYLDAGAERTVLILPPFVNRVETEAFAGTSAYVYELPGGVEFIGERAFAGLKRAALVRILTDNPVEIDDTAFAGSVVTIECPAGSPVESWAQAHNIATKNP